MATQEKGTAPLLLRPDQIRLIPTLNPREQYGDMKSLKQNIAENGIKVPGKVIRRTKDKTDDGLNIYELVVGHRRYRCASELTTPEEYIEFPAIELPSDMTDAQLLMELMIEDVDQRPLDMYEQSVAIKKLLDDGYSKADIARAIGKSQTHVQDCLILIEKGSADLIKQVKSGKLPPSTAIEMLKAGNEADEIAETVEKASAAKGAKGGKVTKKDVEKAAGKPMTKKGSSAGTKTSKGASTEAPAKATGGKNASAIGELEGLLESMDAQKDQVRIEPAFAALNGIIGYLKGEQDPVDLIGIFFEESEDAPKKPAAKAPAKKVNLKEEFAKVESEGKAAKKAPAKAAPAPKKSAAKLPQDDELEDELDDAPAPKKPAAKAPVAATKKAPSKKVVEEEEDELVDETDIDSDFDIADDDDII